MAFSKSTIPLWKQRSSLRSTCRSGIILLFRYDFDKDGYIKKEDVRLILSYIPIEKTTLNKVNSEEGKFVSEGGGK